MADEGKLYYFVCSLMWSVMSAFTYLHDHFQADEIQQRFALWSEHYHELTNWLADELYFPLEHDQTMRSQSRTWLELAEKIGDSVILEATNTLLSISHGNLSKTECLYSGYCRWLLKTLIEFENTMQEAPLFLAVFYERYQGKISSFQALREQLSNERPNNEKLPDTVNLDMERTAELLVIQWRQALESVL